MNGDGGVMGPIPVVKLQKEGFKCSIHTAAFQRTVANVVVNRKRRAGVSQNY